MSAYGLFFLVAVAIGGVAWVFVYPFISGERKTERRMARVSRSEPMKGPTRRAAQKPRRPAGGRPRAARRRGAAAGAGGGEKERPRRGGGGRGKKRLPARRF